MNITVIIGLVVGFFVCWGIFSFLSNTLLKSTASPSDILPSSTIQGSQVVQPVSPSNQPQIITPTPTTASTPTSTPIPTSTPTPTSTSTSTTTPTSTPIPTSTSTSTATPTSTSTATPTSTSTSTSTSTFTATPISTPKPIIKVDATCVTKTIDLNNLDITFYEFDKTKALLGKNILVKEYFDSREHFFYALSTGIITDITQVDPTKYYYIGTLVKSNTLTPAKNGGIECKSEFPNKVYMPV